MSVKIIDTSALAAILFKEPEGEHMASRLLEHELHAPSLLSYELASVAWAKVRKGELSAQDAEQALTFYSEIMIILHDVDIKMILALALSHELTAYDASYLWLAHTLGGELVTLDKKLLQAVTVA